MLKPPSLAKHPVDGGGYKNQHFMAFQNVGEDADWSIVL